MVELNIGEQYLRVCLGHRGEVLLLAVMGSHLHPQHAEARKINPVSRRLASVEAAARELGFRAAVGLEEGLRDLVGWWRRERAWPAEAAGEGRPNR